MVRGRIFISGEVGVETTLLDVIRQVKAQSSADAFDVFIDSNGGYVDAGFAIADYLKNLGKPVTTITSRAYSIASVIFMAGSTRIIPTGAVNALMIHLPWMEAAGSHGQISEYLKDLKATEDNLVKFYSNALDIDSDTIHSLLQNETYLNASEALEMGFATTLQVAAPAVAKLNNKEDKEEDSFMKKFSKQLETIQKTLNKFIGVKAELILQDVTGVELVFPDLADSDAAAVDAKVLVDNAPAQGEFIMPSGETIKVENGVVTEIATVEELAPEEEAPLDAEEETPTEEQAPTNDKDAKIAELEKKIAELEAKLAEAANNADVEDLVNTLQTTADKYADLESRFTALAKQVGSDFTNTNSPNESSTIKAKEEVQKTFSIRRK